MKKFNYPLWIFGRSDTTLLMKRFVSLARPLFIHLKDEMPFIEKRSLLRMSLKRQKMLFFKENLQVYNKICDKDGSLNVLLFGLLISLGLNKKISLQYKGSLNGELVRG
jgi:hypothetical protein